MGRLGSLDAREDFLVLARDALEPRFRRAVERLRVLARVLPDVHGLLAHDVRRLLEQPVVALDLGVALLHHLLLLRVPALAAWRVCGSFVSIEAFISRSFFLWRSASLDERRVALLPMGMARRARSMVA